MIFLPKFWPKIAQKIQKKIFLKAKIFWKFCYFFQTFLIFGHFKTSDHMGQIYVEGYSFKKF